MGVVPILGVGEASEDQGPGPAGLPSLRVACGFRPLVVGTGAALPCQGGVAGGGVAVIFVLLRAIPGWDCAPSPGSWS